MRRRINCLWRWTRHHAVLIAGVISGAFVSLWFAIKRPLRKHKSKHIDVPEFKKNYGSVGRARFREKLAWTILGTVALMWVVHGTGLDQYYQASILNVNEKNEIVREAKKRIGKGYRLGETGPKL